jgi:hypothetical protein
VSLILAAQTRSLKRQVDNPSRVIRRQTRTGTPAPRSYRRFDRTPRHACLLTRGLRSTLRQNRSSTQRRAFRQTISPARDCRRPISLFSLITVFGFGRNRGRQRHERTATASRSSGHGRPRGRTRGPNYPIRPLCSTQNNIIINNTPSIHHPPPGPTPSHHHTNLPLPANHQPHYRCLTTHTRSWGWVVKHRPHQPSLAVAWQNPCNQGKNKGVGPATIRRKHDTHPTTNRITPHHHSAHAVTPSRPHNYSQTQDLSAVNLYEYGLARHKRGDRRRRHVTDSPADLVSQKEPPKRSRAEWPTRARSGAHRQHCQIRPYSPG